MRYFIDTNIFLRSLHKENPKIFSDCIMLVAAIKENKIDAYTGTIVLTEVAYTLKTFYHFEKDKIIEGLQGIINISGLKILDSYDQNLALNIFEKHSIKYIDALIASNEEIYTRKMTIISYDSDFDKLKILRKEPSQVAKD